MVVLNDISVGRIKVQKQRKLRKTFAGNLLTILKILRLWDIRDTTPRTPSNSSLQSDLAPGMTNIQLELRLRSGSLHFGWLKVLDFKICLLQSFCVFLWFSNVHHRLQDSCMNDEATVGLLAGTRTTTSNVESLASNLFRKNKIGASKI